MLIDCINCSKTFEIEEILIPENGRLLECGKCEHRWFYKKIKTEDKEVLSKYVEKITELVPAENTQEKEENHFTDNNINKNDKKNINIFKIFLVTIISFIAFIVIIDTFKLEIQIFFPQVSELLNNLYQTLHDVILFFKDLLK